MKEYQSCDQELVIKITVVLTWITCTVSGILFFGEHLGDNTVRIDTRVLAIIVLATTVLAPAIVFGLRRLYNYWRKPTCPRCGSRKQGTYFGQLPSGEKVCGFCHRHYWHQGWRNLLESPASTSLQPVWFCMPFCNERGVTVFVLAAMSALLIFLGNLTQIPALTSLGKGAGLGILIAVAGLILWQFIRIKWQQQVFRWRVEAGVIAPKLNKVSLGFFREQNENDPREYFWGIILGVSSNRCSDVVVVKDIVTGEYKNFLIPK